MRKICVWFLLLPVLLTGCKFRNKAALPLCRVVTQVDVEWTHNEQHHTYNLRAAHEIRPVLIYLRTLRSMGQSEIDPEKLEVDRWKIVVHRSDGSQRVYRQQGEEYLSRDFSPWMNVDRMGKTSLEGLIRSFREVSF